MKPLFIILFSMGLMVHGQIVDDDVKKSIQEVFPKNVNSDNNNNNNDFFTGLEEVTSLNNGSYGASEKCGEGTTRGVKKCVAYHQCDGKTNTIVETGVEDGFGIIDIRFEANSCDHNLDVCCKLDVQGGDNNNNNNNVGDNSNNNDNNNPNTSPNPVTVSTPTVNKPSNCGIRNPNGIDFKITGNTNNEAEYGEFPWTLAILDYKTVSQNENSPLICGGSLITPNVVLTGAHCVYKHNLFDLVVRAGEWDTQTVKERLPYQERSVKRVISHPDFNHGNLYNDVALLILTESINQADNVGTICLPTQNTIINSKNCFVTGWGKNMFGQAGVRQAILKKIELPTIERRKCQEALRATRLGSRFALHNSFICAGGEQGKDACTGDGGSPLICPDPTNPQRYVQAGIVAWGIGCGTLNVPGVYVDVSKFRSWIDQELRRIGIEDSPYTV